MFDIFVRVNNETLLVSEQISLMECSAALPPAADLLLSRRKIKILPPDLNDFERVAATVVPVMYSYRAFSCDATREQVGQCMKYLIWTNKEKWFADIAIADLRAVTMVVTLNGDGISYVSDEAAAVEWADAMAMAKMEFETASGTVMLEEPVYTHVPRGTTADSYAVAVTTNGITHPLKRATPRAMRSVLEYYQKIIFPKMASEALANPKLPPRDVHMIVLTQEVLRASRIFRDFEAGLDGLGSAPHDVKIAATTLMGCAAKLITTEAKKLNRSDRTRLRGCFLSWDFEEPGEDVYECWLGDQIDIMAHPFTVTMNFVLTDTESRPVKLFEFPTPAFLGEGEA